MAKEGLGHLNHIAFAKHGHKPWVSLNVQVKYNLKFFLL